MAFRGSSLFEALLRLFEEGATLPKLETGAVMKILQAASARKRARGGARPSQTSAELFERARNLFLVACSLNIFSRCRLRAPEHSCTRRPGQEIDEPLDPSRVFAGHVTVELPRPRSRLPANFRRLGGPAQGGTPPVLDSPCCIGS